MIKYEDPGPENWFTDKWNWLKSFNRKNIPLVVIKAGSITQKESEKIFYTRGRVNVQVYVDVINLKE